jgi:predicted nucleotidyltransferase
LHSPEATAIPNPVLERLTPALAAAPGVLAIALGGSRARGTATPSSDFDVGLYYREGAEPRAASVREAVRDLIDDPHSAVVTEVGDWGPWIDGGAWLTVAGAKVDLLYRCADAVRDVIRACRAGYVSMNYQPGHPHGFSSAIWMGEAAICRPLHDPEGLLAELKAMTEPFPALLREALIRRFQWEVLFSVENAETAVGRGAQTHIAGCAYRALSCVVQVLFALNRRYFVNEKGALEEAADFPTTLAGLTERASFVWRAIGGRTFGKALDALKAIERELRAVTANEQFR